MNDNILYHALARPPPFPYSVGLHGLSLVNHITIAVLSLLHHVPTMVDSESP